MTRAGERRVRPARQARRQGGAPRARRRGARARAPGRVRAAQAEPALGRAAPARRAGARARQPARRAAARRAAGRARPQAAPGDADRAQAHPADGRHHVHLRHARPGGGALDERPAGRVQRRAGSSRSGARRRSTSGPRRRSSPTSSAPRTCSATGAPCGPRSCASRTPAYAPQPGEETRRGTIEDVVYLGPITRYVVRLEDGSALGVLAQNLAQTSTEVRAAQGRPVQVVWHGAHAVAITTATDERGERMKKRIAVIALATAALLATSVAATAKPAGKQARRRAQGRGLGGLHGEPVGQAVREADGVHGPAPVRRQLGRDVQPHEEERRLRPRLGLGRRIQPPDRERPRAADRPRDDSQLEAAHAAARQGPEPLRRRQVLRRCPGSGARTC